MCTQKKDGRTAPGVCGNGSVPLSHSGNVVTKIGIHTIHTCTQKQLTGVDPKATKLATKLSPTGFDPSDCIHNKQDVNI